MVGFISSSPPNSTSVDSITYSDHYYDNQFEYRHVILPLCIGKMQSSHRALIPEKEWRALGVTLSDGWVHYLRSSKEPNVLFFRRPLPTQITELQTAQLPRLLSDSNYLDLWKKILIRTKPRIFNIEACYHVDLLALHLQVIVIVQDIQDITRAVETCVWHNLHQPLCVLLYLIDSLIHLHRQYEQNETDCHCSLNRQIDLKGKLRSPQCYIRAHEKGFCDPIIDNAIITIQRQFRAARQYRFRHVT